VDVADFGQALTQTPYSNKFDGEAAAAVRFGMYNLGYPVASPIAGMLYPQSYPAPETGASISSGFPLTYPSMLM
jgi:hypothetical protein